MPFDAHPYVQLCEIKTKSGLRDTGNAKYAEIDMMVEVTKQIGTPRPASEFATAFSHPSCGGHRGSHHLRARRRGCVAAAGSRPPFPTGARAPHR